MFRTLLLGNISDFCQFINIRVCDTFGFSLNLSLQNVTSDILCIILSKFYYYCIPQVSPCQGKESTKSISNIRVHLCNLSPILWGLDICCTDTKAVLVSSQIGGLGIPIVRIKFVPEVNHKGVFGNDTIADTETQGI